MTIFQYGNYNLKTGANDDLVTRYYSWR